MRPRVQFIALLAALGFAVAPTAADQTIFDFEAPGAADAWTPGTPGASASVTKEFASSGEQALKVSFPGFVDGKPKRRLIEAHPPVRDFTEFRWMVTDVTNPTERDITMHGQLYGGENDADRASKFFRYAVPAMTTARIVHGLTFGDRPFAKDISTLRLFMEDFDAEPATLVIDRVTLVEGKRKPSGDTPPELQKAMDAALRDVTAEHIADARAELKQSELPKPLVDAAKKEIDRIEAMLAGFADAETGRKMQTYWGSQYLKPMLARLAQLEAYGKASGAIGKGDGTVVAGFASPMKRVMPRHLPVNLTIAAGTTLSAAKDERESVQIAIAPLEHELQNVRVSVASLRSESGAAIPASMIDAELVAFTETTQKPGYEVDYVGWWPDPLIAEPKPVNVAVGDVQPWWIRVHVPKDQAAGHYTGAVTIAGDNLEPISLELSVLVHDFPVPPHTPFPTAISTLHNKHKNFFGKPYIGGTERWNNELKLKHADFLADYYITLDSIYRHTDDASALDMDIIRHLHDQGRLGPFSIGYYFSDQPRKLEAFRANYEAVKAAGLEEYAYLYGYDEQGKWSFPKLSAASRWFAENFPGPLVLTTAKAPLDLPDLEGHIPINAGYHADLADHARRKYDKQVWWYTCIWPPHPYPNFFLEYEPMDARVLMGAMTARNRPDGFLYYSTTWFNDNEGIDTYPYTNWNPTTFPKSHGDGRLLYIDPEGQLLSSMMLENYRDGLEDLAYHMILQHKLNLYDQQHNGWVRLVRQGDTLTGYRSGDGQTWQKIDSVSFPMDRPVYVGFASAAHSRDIPGEVTFSDITVRGEGGDGWQSRDIGPVDAPGQATFDGESGEVSLTDHGRDIWGTRDAMHFAFRRLTGDGAITARIANMKNADDWYKAGVMVRSGLDADGANVLVALTPTHGTVMQARTGAGRATAGKASADESDWARAARQALADVNELAPGRTSYNDDPAALEAYRRRLAELIESSPIADNNPWPNGIPVRGVDVYRP